MDNLQTFFKKNKNPSFLRDSINHLLMMVVSMMSMYMHMVTMMWMYNNVTMCRYTMSSVNYRRHYYVTRVQQTTHYCHHS